MKRFPTLERILDRQVVARKHPLFRPVEWRPFDEALELTVSEGVKKFVEVGPDTVALSQTYLEDRSARPNRPHTWQSIAAIAVTAEGFSELMRQIPDGQPAVYRLLPDGQSEVGVLRHDDVKLAKEVAYRPQYVHGVRLGLTGGKYGIGVCSPEGALVTLPKTYHEEYGPLTVDTVLQKGGIFTDMRFS